MGKFHELVVNLHMHTTYSDGHGSHADIVQAALETGLDAVIVTDHNVLVEGLDDYHSDGERKVLLIVGEEVHDQARQPQKNHLLVLGADRELAQEAWDPQRLLNKVKEAGGLSFLAHPFDPEAPAFNEDDLSWENWEVEGYTGIELWNQLSEFKSLLSNKLMAAYYALNPNLIARGPFPEVLEKWDELLKEGRRVAAIGGTDAHALPGRLGPIRRTIFPYNYHFKCINTHLLVNTPLSGEVDVDRRLILRALSKGNAFIGYDLPASTRGFRFSAHGYEQNVIMGDKIHLRDGITLQIRLPRVSECRLLRDGEVVQTWDTRETCTYITNQPGVYRVEVYINYQGQRRGWIFSNPIYVK
jgi:hypothetical protein